MISLVGKELRRLLPLLVICLLLMGIAATVVGFEQYLDARGKPDQNEQDSPYGADLEAVQNELLKLESWEQEQSYTYTKYTRPLQTYRYLLQHGMPAETYGEFNMGSLLINIGASLPLLLALPAALLGGMLATHRTQTTVSRWKIGLSKLLALMVSILLLATALLLLVWLMGQILIGNEGLAYPQLLNSFIGSGYDSFLILTRWQVLLWLLAYGVATGLTVATLSAAVSLLCGHWLTGFLLVGGASLFSIQLPWLTDLFTFLNADKVWLQAGSRLQLFSSLLTLLVLGMIGLISTALLFPRLSPVMLSERRLLSKRLIMRVFRSVRWRFILLFLFSGGLAVIGVFIALGFALTIYRLDIMQDYFELLYRAAGMPLIIGFGAALFIVFFFILTSRITLYLEEISLAVGQIARGDWSVQIPKRFNDELGELAVNINSMVRQLVESRDEERRAEQAKTELITSVSHDLRTPLTSVLGYLELIAQSDPSNSGDWQRYAAVARGKAQRLQRLIDGLFEYTRLAYGGLEIHCRPISLDSLLRQLAEEFVPILQQANMEQQLQLPEQRVTVQADGDLLVRVFDNLYSNAIRYGQSAGQLSVTLLERDGQAVVQVVNFGPQIPEQDLSHIFERLYRADKARSAQAGGAGLGLAIAKQIVELHRGRIFVESDEQRTVFTVCLPLADNGVQWGLVDENGERVSQNEAPI